MGVTPSSARVIEDVDCALEALEIVFRANGAAFEGITGRNGHILNELGEGRGVSLVCAQTKVEGRSIPCSFDITRGISLVFTHSTADVQVMSDRPDTN